VRENNEDARGSESSVTLPEYFSVEVVRELLADL
jgi:hypothetical protein